MGHESKHGNCKEVGERKEGEAGGMICANDGYCSQLIAYDTDVDLQLTDFVRRLRDERND